jgi:hypothetical protein|tara:strand:- start:431 stop:580 length:150 start_codon:yes stop_codon:yes gene_type:complete
MTLKSALGVCPTTRRLTTILIEVILEMMEVGEMHGVMPNSMPVIFTIDL